MTAANAMKLVDVKDGKEKALVLTPEERDFAEEYFVNGRNATRAYMKVYPDVTVDYAGANGSVMLNSTRVQEFLRQLTESAIGPIADKMIPWVDLLPQAQQVIVATAEGRLRSRIQFDAAVHLCNRVLGMPPASTTHELIVKDTERIRQGVRNFSRRLKEAQMKLLVAPDVEIPISEEP